MSRPYALDAEILCADGRTFQGRVFVPALASHHTRPHAARGVDERPVAVLPVPARRRRAPVLMNKREVLVLSVVRRRRRATRALSRRARIAAWPWSARPGAWKASWSSTCRAHLRRVLDCLNRPQPFLTVHDGDRQHLIRKERITRVLEIPEA